MPEEIALAYEELPEKVDFNFHVRPILSDRCYHCHGPDEQARKASLRLDIEKEAFQALESGNGHAIVAGNARKSQLIHRILSEDPEVVMPTPASKLTLTATEKATIIKWIEQGAEWKEHWAFIPPQKGNIPTVTHKDWVQHNPIDAFIQSTLEKEGLEPAKEATKERLLRRVYMDLTGLPPSLEEIDAFLADTSPEAYEKVVDRLLASSAHAERMAMEWMDVSRYADSHGMHADGFREMWQWRDWVINAFNENMPYDEFVTYQLAGDLLPNSNRDHILATAFNRNHPMTAEGGAIDEEFRLNYVFDRTETVSTVFMGLTIGCARCHDHKFDPISQEDYYRTAAFFNNIQELGMTGDDGNFGPMLMLADSLTEEKLTQITKEIKRAEASLAQTEKNLVKTLEQPSAATQITSKRFPKGLIQHYPFEQIDKRKQDGRDQWYVDGNTNATCGKEKSLVDGRVGKALEFDGTYDELYLSEVGFIEMYEPFSAGVWINTTKRKENETQVLFGNAGVKNTYWRGWDFYLDSLNRLTIRLIHSLPHNYLHVHTQDSIKVGQWTHVAFTYDGSSKAEGLTLYVDGKLVPTEIAYDRLYKTILPITYGEEKLDKRPLRVAKSYRAFTGEEGIFKGRMDEITLFKRELLASEIALLYDHASTPTVSDIRTFVARQDRQYQHTFEELTDLRREFLKVMNPVTEVMVMEELPEPKPMYVYNRGEYDAPLYRVNIGTPQAVLDYPENLPENRWGMAQWLFMPEHPLTARVTVNRYWQMLYGKGIVNTPQDFGVQGALPTHPELLDWLAVEFMDNGWDLKYLLKLMVMSSTYRQSSVASPEHLEKDPLNIYLARGASYRLPAEMIRDNSLAASGLLVQKVGGKSVFPYQPEGLWIEKGNFSHKLLRYKESEGEDLYRRSMYTFIKRTSPPPAMTVFDVPNRDVCVVKRERTNTPLQALVLLNDPQFVEAARVLAERVQLSEDNPEAQIQQAFRLLTSRTLTPEELSVFLTLFYDQQKRFQERPEEAKELLSVGDYPVNDGLEVSEMAAMAMVTSTMLNHDEAYMKR